ncbi:toprim domain-containing protein [Ancylobacter sonchi]|uniref:toprim domain-containing protein n=1 Tax=Ancylobacter sonchi TaxID=1937790 RepID=UPI001BD5A9B2|nr:toprim domain-containing protein [Ancylobacter sonchi]MBS7535040.1 toprim domain-containing protein [Ancylobacter sonchi]
MTQTQRNSYRAIKDAALSDLAAWVPALGLPRLKRTQSGYSAVAGFRSSRRAGLPNAKRPRALSFSNRGIRDHAEGQSYSPIDIVVACLGLDPRSAKDWLSDALGGTVAAADRPAPPPPLSIVRSPRSMGEAVLRRWAQCIPITGTLAEAYLASRGLSYDGDALRYYPRDQAMAALVTDPATGDAHTIQFTYLDEQARKLDRLFMKGYPSTGVVRLSSDDSVTTGLAIAEGIETALAAPFRPVWACLVANNLSAFPVLGGIEALTIFADHDAAGLAAANDCGARWHSAGAEVTIVTPACAGADMADLAEAA